MYVLTWSLSALYGGLYTFSVCVCVYVWVWVYVNLVSVPLDGGLYTFPNIIKRLLMYTHYIHPLSIHSFLIYLRVFFVKTHLLVSPPFTVVAGPRFPFRTFTKFIYRSGCDKLDNRVPPHSNIMSNWMKSYFLKYVL